MDPKMPKGAQAGSRVHQAFRDAVVCVVGGGNYLEYQGLQEMARAMPQKCNVVYGSTEMLMPTEFLQQITELGTKA